MLKEAALVLLFRRQVDREAGVRAFEPSVHVAMADRRVAPRVDVNVRFLEELVRHGRGRLRANVHAGGGKGEAEAEQRAPHARPDVAVPGGGRQCHVYWSDGPWRFTCLSKSSTATPYFCRFATSAILFPVVPVTVSFISSPATVPS